MRALVWVWVLFSATPAAADPPADEISARRHFEAGRKSFHLKHYTVAVEEFEAGYRDKPLPLFLYNIGHAAMRSGQRDKALQAFRQYLVVSPAAPERVEVERLIREWAPPEPSPIPEVVPSPAPLAPIVIAPPPKAKRPAWTWALVAVAGAVGVGLAVGLGVGLGTQPHYPSAPLGVLDFGR